MNAAEKTARVVERARSIGFDLCGIAPVEGLAELSHLDEWLARGYAGEMRYLCDARRHSPAAALEGARSIIVVALNYNTLLPYSTEIPSGPETGSLSRVNTGASASEFASGPRGWISRYAWGDDYHEVLGEKLNALLEMMHSDFAEDFQARAYVDTGPVLERVAAKYAGLGWLGKNTCLINEQIGSWLFLGVIMSTLDLAASLGASLEPPPDLCGQCRQCIDACPTGAIVEPYVLDARRCISYLTIELRGSIPEELREPMGRMVFGCDICQDVCPWNRKAPVTNEMRFLPRLLDTENTKTEIRNGKFESREGADVPTGRPSLFQPELERLAGISEDQFKGIFRGSAVKRTKWRGLLRNACVALGNAAAQLAKDSSRRQRAIAVLERLADSGDAVIVEHARWALRRIEHRPRSARPALDSDAG